VKSPAAIELKAIDFVEGVEDDYLKSLNSTYRKLQAKLTAYLKDVGDAAQTGAVDAARAMQDIQGILLDSGMYAQGRDVLTGGAKAALQASQKTYAELYSEELQYSPQAKQYIDSLRQSTLADYEALTAKLATQVQTITTDLSFGATSYNVAVEQVAKLLDISLGQATTWTKTAMASIHRASTVSLGEELGIERYQYVGPKDKLNRDFCKSPGEGGHLNEIKTLEEWKNLSNGQIGNAATMGGGYNCRHRLVAVGQIK
jgi:hypothetical protein